MNILYLGTVCAHDKYENMLKGCKVKPSVASIVFETAVIRGFSENKANVEILSYPMIPIFPKSRLLHFGGNGEMYGYRCHYLRTFNLPVLKQLTRRMSACKEMKKWAKNNVGEGVILTYSIPPFLAKDILRYSEKYQLKAVAIIPDLLKNMYINHKSSFAVNALRNLYLHKSLALQSEYDGYVYLTEAMREEVADGKPYMVMEGILDASASSIQIETPKFDSRAIMYAGRIHEKFGVLNLVDAFEKIEDDSVELWLFGEGSAVEEIQNRAKNDKRIKYFGRVGREEVLSYEKRASILVNLRSTKDPFTKYSFPSKTIEYMASGTPLLTTKLMGIPSEYFDYSFSIEDNTVEEIKNALVDILQKSDEDLKNKGQEAQRFVIDNKNAKTQASRIIEFLRKIRGEEDEGNSKK